MVQATIDSVLGAKDTYQVPSLVPMLAKGRAKVNPLWSRNRRDLVHGAMTDMLPCYAESPLFTQQRMFTFSKPMFSPGAQLVTIATVNIVVQIQANHHPVAIILQVVSRWWFSLISPMFKPIRYHLFYRRCKMSGEHRGTSRDLSHKRPDLPGQEGTGARFFGAY